MHVLYGNGDCASCPILAKSKVAGEIHGSGETRRTRSESRAMRVFRQLSYFLTKLETIRSLKGM